MSRIKDWFADHKEIILAGGTFLLGCIVTGAIERSRHNGQTFALDIYNKAVRHANDVIIPDINAKYDNIDFNIDMESYEKYLDEYDTRFNQAIAHEIFDTLGLPNPADVRITHF